VRVVIIVVSVVITFVRAKSQCVWNIHFACRYHIRPCRYHIRDCHIHTHTCQNYSRVCGNHNLVRVEITLVRVGITFVLVEITLRVEITLCELKSHYAYEIALLCVNHTRLVVQRQCQTLVSAQY
jgi:hypothetical protein